MSADAKNKFVTKTPENADLNQYWYSPKTISKLVEASMHRKTGRITSRFHICKLHPPHETLPHRRWRLTPSEQHSCPHPAYIFLSRTRR